MNLSFYNILFQYPTFASHNNARTGIPARALFLLAAQPRSIKRQSPYSLCAPIAILRGSGVFSGATFGSVSVKVPFS